MKRYVGTKVINAEPMTRQAYVDLRGWSMPADENPADEGYLVEYLDGGKPNHPLYNHYISWSPKDVFERAYHAVQADKPLTPDSFLTRMQIERTELAERRGRLAGFLMAPADSQIIAGLSDHERDLMDDQMEAMDKYDAILTERIECAIARLQQKPPPV